MKYCCDKTLKNLDSEIFVSIYGSGTVSECKQCVWHDPFDTRLSVAVASRQPGARKDYGWSKTKNAWNAKRIRIYRSTTTITIARWKIGYRKRPTISGTRTTTIYRTPPSTCACSTSSSFTCRGRRSTGPSCICAVICRCCVRLANVNTDGD